MAKTRTKKLEDRLVPVTFNMKAGELSEIDSYAFENRMDRSALLRAIIRRSLRQRRNKTQIPA